MPQQREDWQEQLKKRAKEKGKGGKFKLEPNTETCLRILPVFNDGGEIINGSPLFEFNAHRNVGPKKRFVRCGLDLDGAGVCWVCDKVDELSNSGARSKQTEAEDMKLELQCIAQVAWVEDGKWHGPSVWYIPNRGKTSLDTKVMSFLARASATLIDVDKGRNINIERIGAGMLDTKYQLLAPDDEPSAVPDAILDKCKTFDKLFPVLSTAKMKAVYLGEDVEYDADSDSDGDEEIEHLPKAGRRAVVEPALEEQTAAEELPPERPARRTASVEEQLAVQEATATTRRRAVATAEALPADEPELQPRPRRRGAAPEPALVQEEPLQPAADAPRSRGRAAAEPEPAVVEAAPATTRRRVVAEPEQPAPATTGRRRAAAPAEDPFSPAKRGKATEVTY